jgi:phosphoribosylglycinamide formyltransferase-1
VDRGTHARFASVLAGGGERLLDCGVTTSMRTLAVLASGQGTNFGTLALAALRGEIPGRIAVMLTDRPDAPVVGRARGLGIEVEAPPTGSRRTCLDDEGPWIEALERRGVEWVLLAGFMRRLHAAVLGAFPQRIVNIHPSLLPAFPGRDAIRRAFELDIAVTGCTVHLVDERLDAGPIVAQEPVAVHGNDTLETLTERIHDAEHRLYPRAVRRLLTESWRVDGDHVVFGASVGAGSSHA